MATISISREHQLGLKGARDMAQQLEQRLHDEYGMETQWNTEGDVQGQSGEGPGLLYGDDGGASHRSQLEDGSPQGNAGACHP